VSDIPLISLSIRLCKDKVPLYAERMSLNRLIKAAIFLVWVSCMAWLIRYEAFPHWFEHTVQGYSGLMRDMPAVRDSWMRVYFRDAHVGYAHSSIELDDSAETEDVLLQYALFMRVRMPEGSENLRMSSSIRLDVNMNLTSFELGFYFGEIRGEMQAVALGKDSYDVRLKFQGNEMHRTMTYPSNAILSTPLMDIGLRELKPGKQMRLRVVDPLSFTGETKEIVMRGERQEWITLHDAEKPVQTTRVAVDSGGITTRAWINELGQVLRQETPFGLMLEMATTQEAISVPSENAIDPRELLSSSSLPGFAMPSFPKP
jgi:hypothetical protein